MVSSPSRLLIHGCTTLLSIDIWLRYPWTIPVPRLVKLKPIERVWEYLKEDLIWELFENLDNLRAKVAQLLAQLTPEIVASLTGYDYILNALSVANIF